MTLPDPGGIFASDSHRRVLAHLSTPDAGYGWEVEPLLGRVGADPHTPFGPGDEKDIAPILDDLVAEKLATQHEGGIYQMTQAGLDALSGPIANEPPLGAPVSGPADLGPTPLAGKTVTE